MFIKVTLAKYLAQWCVFALTYVIWFVGVYLAFPETWFFSVLTEQYGFIDSVVWDNGFMTFCLLLALLLNLITIMLVMRGEIEKK